MWAIFIVVLTPEQAMQAAISKNVKLLSPTSTPVKQLPMPPGMNPSNSAVALKSQNASKPFLPPPPTPPKVLLQQQPPQKRPPLPSTRPPLPALPPPPPPPSLPPPPPAPNQMLMPQGVASMPPPPMQPPPIPGGNFPMYSYAPIQNAAQSFPNPMFSQPPNLIPPPVPAQYRSHDTMPPSMGGVQYMGEAVPSRPPNYNDNYSQREPAVQQQSHSYSDYDIAEDAYDESRQNRVFARDGAYPSGSYGNGSQHYADASQHYSESAQHYVDASSQHYSEAAYQQFRGSVSNKRVFNRNSRPPPPPPQYQNRQVRSHPYQRR